MFVAFEQGKFSFGPRLQLFIKHDKRAKAISPIRRSFDAPTIPTKTTKEKWQILPRGSEQLREQVRIFHLGQRSAEDALMANGIPVVRHIFPMKWMVEIVLKN